MAPALTEPLSPTEKLSNRKATSSPNTRSSKRFENSSTLLTREKRSRISTAHFVNRRTRNNNRLQLKGDTSIQEKPTSTTSPVASPSESLSSPSNSPHTSSSSSPPITTTTPDIKTNLDSFLNSNEQMGVSNATHLTTANITAENEIHHSSYTDKDIDDHRLNNSLDNNVDDEEELGQDQDQHQHQDQEHDEEEEQQHTVTSTEQLLKDLTDNFEEAITAEICLRRQLVETDLVKETKVAFKEAKDIILRKPGKGGAPEVNSTLMESPTTTTQTQELNETTKDDERILNAILDDIDDVSKLHPSAPNEEIVSSNTLDETKTKSKESISQHEGNANKKDKEIFLEPSRKNEKQIILPISITPLAPHQTNAVRKIFSTHLNDEKPIITSVQVLPRINTDSTMSASEIEDNIEERLMMLEGCTPSTTQPEVTHLTSNSTSRTHSMQSVLPSVQNPQQQQHQQNPFSNTSAFGSASGEVVGTTGQISLQQPSNCNDFEDQDIEEVLKALKGFDNNSAFDGDLNVLLNEVYTSLNCEEIAGTGNTAGVAENVPSHSIQLNSTSNDSHISSITEIKASPIQESHLEICNTQENLLKRLDNQMRRLRKMQVRHMCKHISEEIAGLIEWSARWSNKSHNGDITSNEGSDVAKVPFKFLLQSRPPTNTWSEEQKTHLPVKQINQFLQRLEAVALAQQQNASNMALSAKNSPNINMTPIRKSKKMQQHEALMAAGGAIGGTISATGVSSPSATTKAQSPVHPQLQQETKIEEVVPTFDEDVTEELYQVSGLLHCQMHQMQKAYDSDATDSSSGAESADEAISYNNSMQQQRPIPQRATYQYSKDRGRIAARWSWLQSQSADTEIRIRQLLEISAEARRSKANAFVGVQADTYYKPLEFSNKSVNGYKSSDYGSSTDLVNESVALPDCARTRVNVTKNFRKRKLLQTANLHTISKKAARPSTLKCGCQWPLNPCALCTGRADPTALRDPPDTMARADRIALVDAGFHPVLSLQDEDVGTSLHFEAIACLADWQIRVMRCQAKSIVKSVWKAEREAAAASGNGRRNGEPKRRYVRKKDKLAGERAAAIDAVPLGPTSNPPRAVTTLLASLNDRGVDTGGKYDGNGTGLLSSTCSSTSTPLVANNLLKQKKIQNRYSQEYLMNLNTSTINNSNSNTNSNTMNNQQNNSKLNKLINQRNRSISSSNATINAINQQNNLNNISQNFTNNSSPSIPPPPTHISSHSGYILFNGSNGGDASDNWDRSRTSSPTHSHHKNERLLDRKSRSSYDIDNIVIPYSVAAATKVEILPYKEIPIPKWRVINDENNELKITSEDCNGNEMENESVNGKISPSCEIQKEIVITHTDETNLMSKKHRKSIKKDKSEQKDPSSNTVKEEELAPKSISLNENSSVTNEESSSNKQKRYEENENKNNLKDFKEPSAKKFKLENGLPLKVCDEDDKEKEEPLLEVDGKDEETDTSSETSLDEGHILKHNNFIKPGQWSLKSSPWKSKELLPPPPPPPKINQVSTVAAVNEDEEEYEFEDISDEAIMLRHERASAEEKKKFQALLKYPWSSRSRANRRMDSRTESSGANTPDPASPAPRTPSVGGGDNESIPSPLNPSTPLESTSEAKEHLSFNSKECPLNSSTISNTIQKRYERRRTTSAKKENHDLPNHIDIPPYEPLVFPLSNDLYSFMLNQMPEDYRDILNSANEYTFHETTADDASSKTNCDAHIPSDFLRSSSITTQHRTTSDTTSKNSLNKYRRRPRNESAASSKSHDHHHVGDDDPSLDGHDIFIGNDLPDEEDDGGPNTTDTSGDEDFYPKHHLAPPESQSDELDNIDHDRAMDDSPHNPRDVNESNESSDTEPFQDDDPNDPEWKGEKRKRRRFP